MVAVGISYFGLSHIIFVEGTMNDFSYGQTLLFYKEDIDEINKNNNANITLEQDGATCHTSKANINLLDELFGKNQWIQNPPNSPDLAYPIEELWSIIKPRVKRRDPKTIDELKTFILEERNSVPTSLIRKLCSGYLDRVKKVIELKGSRLEPEHLKKTDKKDEAYKWEVPETLPLVRFVYNDKEISKKRIKEIKQIKRSIDSLKSSYSDNIKKSNETKKMFSRKDLKYLSLGRRISIIERPKRLKEERNELVKQKEEKIKIIEKMSLIEYLDYLNGRNNKIEVDVADDNSETTMDEIEERLKKLEEITKKNKNIKYKIRFNGIVNN